MIDPSQRRPRVEALPPVLHAATQPPRTPVVEGRVARPLRDLLPLNQVEPADIEAAVQQAQISPGLDPVWSDCHEDMLHHSLAYFASEMIRGPDEPPYHGRFIVGGHHLEWDEIINNHDKIVIEAARDHGKSLFIATAYPIWRGGYTHPGKLGYIFSNTQQLSEAFLSIIKAECVENERLRHLVPVGVTDARKWGKANELQMRNGSVIRARGMGVKVRGGHPYWAVADDILEDDDIYSETIRRKHIDYFLGAINNMVVPGGQIVVVGTPFAATDLYGYLRETGEYYCVKYPAIDRDGNVLFEERYSRELLEKRKRELGSAARFAREFLCTPFSEESSLFPSHLFEGPDVRVPYALGLGYRFWDSRGCTLYTGVDFAMSSETGADYTVIFTVAKDPSGCRWIANIRRGKGWGFQRQLDEIKEEYALMRPAVIHAEANQMQRIFTDELIRETDIPIRKFFTSGVQPRQPWRKGMTQVTAGKHDLDRGVPSLRMSLENKKWRIPRGDERSIELTDVWIGELQALSWQDGKVISVGAHDDLAMSCWICDTAVRLGGFNFSFGDQTGVDQSASTEGASPVDQVMARTRAKEIPDHVDRGVAPEIVDNFADPSYRAAESPQLQPEPQSGNGEAWKPMQGAPLAGQIVGGFGGNL